MWKSFLTAMIFLLILSTSFAGAYDIHGDINLIINNDSARIQIGRACYYFSSGAESDNMFIRVVASETAYTGDGTYFGYAVCEFAIGTLDSGFCYDNIDQTTPYVEPGPDQEYYIAVALVSYSGDIGILLDIYEFEGKHRLGSGSDFAELSGVAEDTLDIPPQNSNDKKINYVESSDDTCFVGSLKYK
ncbi:hypothetical protein Dalk_4590 [Desulfatibacillum aliphaticivorans]|uniref:Uncharacterized protein n=1 Tax=Desulfatibacillum aliphaticivorans TaxID=218208 RepID=B8FNI7_DESAL|nr:CFI-box putative sorting motif-containing protein [Desulfatibacillum aliphaticivorans]ACL06268.1 hypothetical protein Dalk_4590 [Desulfatibacillum aliphaticivorans]